MNRTNRFLRDAIVSVWGLVLALASVVAVVTVWDVWRYGLPSGDGWVLMISGSAIISTLAAAYWQRNILRAAFAWLFPPGV